MVIVVNVLMNSVLILDMNILLSIIIINMTISNVTTIFILYYVWTAHFYKIDENAKIVIEGDGDCGIEYDSTIRTYTFIVNKYWKISKLQ